MIRAVNVAKTFRGSAFAHRGAVEAVRGVSLALFCLCRNARNGGVFSLLVLDAVHSIVVENVDLK